jgi:hypothetical protein
LRHDPDLQLAFDFAREAELDGVEAEFLEHAFQTNLVVVEVNLVLLEGGDDFGAPTLP